MSLWVSISWKDSGLGASEQTKIRGNCVFYLVIVVKLVGPIGAKRQCFLKLSYAGKGKTHKKEELLWGVIKKTTQGVDHRTILFGITYYFSFLWCKKI